MGEADFPEMNTIIISEEGVLKLLNGLQIHKATGPDGLPTRLPKYLACDLAPVEPSSKHPSIRGSSWKKAYIVPVFKKGAKNKPENYRLVSLTSIIYKKLEHITSNIMRHLEDNAILTDAQHSFRKHQSCETQLYYHSPGSS